jgi:prepilin-type N-terminal cleavage/methylation domain-containing protein
MKTRVPILNCQLSIVNCHSPRRRGFTLVEILTVIVIIGVLMGLILAAAGPVRNIMRNYRMKSEITQLSLSIERVRNELLGGQYPPDGSNQADWQQAFRRAFPRSQQAVPNQMTAASALLFWLGGMVDTNSGSPTNGQYIGFSSNPVNPFDITPGTARIGPFFDFDRTRVVKDGSGNPVFLPQNDMPTSQPYLYFKAVAGAYGQTATVTVQGTTTNQMAYVDSAAMALAGTTTPIWVNPQSFQLMCPGLDGLYSATKDGNPPRYPDGTNYQGNTFDDVTNFTKRAKVESDMP